MTAAVTVSHIVSVMEYLVHTIANASLGFFSQTIFHFHIISVAVHSQWQGGREGGREGWWEGGREGGNKGR